MLIFTNGCFDLLTAAHVRLLKFAGEKGRLVVGLNSDKSVRALKGDTRPINSQEERAEVLRAIRWVSHVTIFDEPTIVDILRIVDPDVWVKGGDYTIDTLNQEEVAVARAIGCKIIFAPKMAGVSTSQVIAKISASVG